MLTTLKNQGEFAVLVLAIHAVALSVDSEEWIVQVLVWIGLGEADMTWKLTQYMYEEYPGVPGEAADKTEFGIGYPGCTAENILQGMISRKFLSRGSGLPGTPKYMLRFLVYNSEFA